MNGRKSLLFADLVLLTLPSALAESPDIEVQYEFGSFATGSVIGTCDSGMVSFEASPTGRLALDGTDVSIDHYRTEVNRSQYWVPPDPDPATLVQYPDQWKTTTRAPSGRIEIEWNQGVVRVFGPGLLALPQRVYPDRFEVGFSGSGLNTSSFEAGIDTTDAYYAKGGLIVSPYSGVLEGWLRWVEIQNAALTLSGEVSIYLENATIRSHDFVYDVPARREIHFEHQEALVRVEQYHVNHIVLRLHSTRTVTYEGAPRLACGDTHYSVNGTTVLLGATGHVGNTTFAERELQLVGNLTLEDASPEEEALIGRSAASRASVGGDVVAVGYDFAAPMSILPATSPKISAWVVAGGLAGGAVTVWAVGRLAMGLFSRLTRETVLEHPKRATIHQAVLANPGVSRDWLRKLTGYDPWTLRFHLRMMVAHGLVATYNGTRNRFVCPKANVEGVPERAYGDLARIVQEQLRAGGPMPLRDLLKEISRGARCGRSSVWYAIQTLVRNGKLSRSVRAGIVWVEEVRR